MTNKNTFGVHFVLRTSKNEQAGKFPVYARITVNKSRCELAIKQFLSKRDWNFGKGAAKPKNDELKQFNSYLEDVRGKLVQHYRQLQINEELLTAVAVKNSYIGKGTKEINRTLLWLSKEHNTLMQKVLKKGSMKNYFTTEKYLKLFLAKKFKAGDFS